MAETFGARLKRLRAEKGLQQSDLAGPGVSISYISMLENGNREPTDRVISHLANALKVEPLLLIGPTPEPELADEERLEIAGAEMLLANGDWSAARDAFNEMELRYGSMATWGLARALESLGDLSGALTTLDRFIATAAGVDGRLIVSAHIARTRCLAEQGEEGAALAAAREAVAICNTLGLPGTDEHAQALSTLVGQLYAVGMYADAEIVASELIAMVDAGATWKARGSAYWNAAGVAEARGDLSTAVAYAQRALALLSEGDDERAWARCAIAAAWFWMRHDPAPDRLRQIEVILNSAESKLRHSGTEVDLAYLETEQARAALLSGDAVRSEELAASALTRLGPEARSERATTLLVLADARLATGETDPTTAEQLQLTLMTLPRGRGTSLTWRGLADVWRRLGQTENAYQALEEALNAQSVTATPAPVPGTPALSTAGTRRTKKARL